MGRGLISISSDDEREGEGGGNGVGLCDREEVAVSLELVVE